MTPEQLAEFERLQKFERDHIMRPLDIAFDKLQGLYDMPYSRGFDGVMSVSAFRTIAECLFLLRKEIK